MVVAKSRRGIASAAGGQTLKVKFKDSESEYVVGPDTPVFGYAAMVPNAKPNRYGFLEELRESACQQVSVETAQPQLDCSTLAALDNKKILLGVIDLSDSNVESAETVAARIRRALPFVPADNIIVAPDCGMKYLPRETAFGKMRAMVAGAAIVRGEIEKGLSVR